MAKKRGRGAVAGFIIAGLVTAGVIVYTLFFNGRFVYFTFGMNGDDIMKTDNVHISETAAKILAADEKQAFLDVSDAQYLDTNISDEPLGKDFKNNVKSKLSRILTLNRMAQDKNISLTKEQTDKARAAADEYLGSLSSDAVSYTGANKDNTFTFFSQYMLAEEMKNRLMADAQIEVSTDEARVIQIQFICSEDEAKVKEAKQKIDAGEVFYEVAAGVNSDSDFDAELTRGMTDKAFEDVAYSLKTGEVSDVFLSGDKYYLIKCSSDNEQTKTDAHREVLTEKEKAEYLEKKIVPFENGLYFEFDESGWNKIQFDKIPETGVTFREIYLKNTQVQ